MNIKIASLLACCMIAALCTAPCNAQKINVDNNGAQNFEIIVKGQQQYDNHISAPAAASDQAASESSHIETFKIYAGGIAIVYGYILTRLLYAARTLFDDQSWALWRKDVPLHVLYQLPQKKVAQELSDAVVQRYRTPINPINALTQFVHNVEVEKDKLKQFLSLHEWLDALLIGFLFPRQKDTIRKTRERIERLDYLKQVVWHANVYAHTSSITTTT